jgi:hypothetical protein
MAFSFSYQKYRKAEKNNRDYEIGAVKNNMTTDISNK